MFEGFGAQPYLNTQQAQRGCITALRGHSSGKGSCPCSEQRRLHVAFLLSLGHAWGRRRGTAPLRQDRLGPGDGAPRAALGAAASPGISRGTFPARG